MPPKRSGSPSKKKGKKGKKLSAAKRAELERKAEEERRRLEEEAERLERERREQEERERLQREEEERRRQEEAERLQAEEAEMKRWKQERREWVAQIVQRAKESEDWEKWLRCSKLTDASSERDVNTYLEQSKDVQETDLSASLMLCAEAEVVAQEMIRLAARAAEHDCDDEAVQHRNHLIMLRDSSFQRVDRATAHVLQHADEFSNSKNELQRAVQIGPLRYGLWVNLAKNPRVKTIEFGSLGMTIDVPKSLALASVSLRMLSVPFDHISARHPSMYLALGGVCHVDLLAMPPPPKRVKGWTLRQITPLARDVQRMPYRPSTSGGSAIPAAAMPTGAAAGAVARPGVTPLIKPGSSDADTAAAASTGDAAASQSTAAAATAAAGASSDAGAGVSTGSAATAATAATAGTAAGAGALVSSWPPVRVSFTLPRQVVVPEKPSVGWWNESLAEWCTDDITGVTFDPSSRRISFATMNLVPHAVIAPRYAEFPFESFSIHPAGSQEAGPRVLLDLYASTQKVSIEVTPTGLCRLVRPNAPELAHLRDKPRTATALLTEMRDAGVCIMPDPHIFNVMRRLGDQIKDEERERELHYEIALVASSHAIAWSRWNSSRPGNKFIFRAREIIDPLAPYSHDEREEELLVALAQRTAAATGAGAGDAADANTVNAGSAAGAAVAASADAASATNVAASSSASATAGDSTTPAAADASVAALSTSGEADASAGAAGSSVTLATTSGTGDAGEDAAEKASSTDAGAGDDDGDASEAAVEERAIWTTLMMDAGAHLNVVPIKTSEASRKCNEEWTDDARIHPHLYHCLRERATQESIVRMNTPARDFQHGVRNLLNLIRPFSFSE